MDVMSDLMADDLMTIRLEQAVCSGEDLDAWGGEQTRPSRVPTRADNTDCVLRDDRDLCPDGCRACEDFSRQMEGLETTKSTKSTKEDEDGSLEQGE